MKNLLKKLIFIAQFYLQDPDPAWRFESGSTRIRIRNTAGVILLKIKISFYKMLNESCKTYFNGFLLSP